MASKFSMIEENSPEILGPGYATVVILGGAFFESQSRVN